MKPITANLASSRVADERWWYISSLRVARKDSATALSWQLPVRPHESPTSFSLVHDASSLEVYWLPRSLWKMALRPRSRACGPARGRDDYVGGHAPRHTPTRPPCGC